MRLVCSYDSESIAYSIPSSTKQRNWISCICYEQWSQLVNRKRGTKTDCIFEKLAFINVFHSQYVQSISYGLAVAGGWKSA
jgi:hypothetical protein